MQIEEIILNCSRNVFLSRTASQITW